MHLVIVSVESQVALPVGMVTVSPLTEPLMAAATSANAALAAGMLRAWTGRTLSQKPSKMTLSIEMFLNELLLVGWQDKPSNPRLSHETNRVQPRGRLIPVDIITLSLGAIGVPSSSGPCNLDARPTSFPLPQTFIKLLYTLR